MLSLLTERPSLPGDRSSKIFALSLQGVAHARLHHFVAAEQNLQEAVGLCKEFSDPACGGVSRAFGVFYMEQGRTDEAEKRFADSLEFAKFHQDPLLEATAFLNLGVISLRQGRFDEAVDRSDEAFRAANALDAKDLEQNARGNLGWAYYRLGKSEKALDMFLEAGNRAAELGDITDQASWLTDAGYVYADERKLDQAERSFGQALSLAKGIASQEDIYDALRALARLSLQKGNLDKASQYAAEALRIARESNNRGDELYPILVMGQVSARRGDSTDAALKFHEIERDQACPVFLRWEARHSLARLYEDQGRATAADREYRTALMTFEAARDSVRREDSQLSYLTNGWKIYDDYVHFLVTLGKTEEALRWANYSRGRTLAEGLGLLAKGASAGPPPLRAQEIARRAQGTLLFYWLGEKQSYLWAITAKQTRLFSLPAADQIEAIVARYRKALGGPQDVLAAANDDGLLLYRVLLAPAQALLPRDAKVFVVPDGVLNNLNFETLLVSEPKLHFWIEDAEITNASSLEVLDESRTDKATPIRRSLLLIGNSVAPNAKYPELPNAAAQMESVAGHFPAAQERVIQREQATPAAYLASQPEAFSYIHFVAHGTANRLSPLDSVIVLSKDNAVNDSFKLYARDIVGHPLRAELVTISACYSAGESAYSGEGLVGLAWAFLRAGAHKVIAASWEATDVSTKLLMDKFYEALDEGASPDVALRVAKLYLLHRSGFRNPFYWAPFQLYTGHAALRQPTHPIWRSTGTLESYNRSRPSTSTREPGRSNR